jgi:hypothetical protein
MRRGLKETGRFEVVEEFMEDTLDWEHCWSDFYEEVRGT